MTTNTLQTVTPSPGPLHWLAIQLARLSRQRVSARALLKGVWLTPFLGLIGVLFVWPLVMLVVGASRNIWVTNSKRSLPGRSLRLGRQTWRRMLICRWAQRAE